MKKAMWIIVILSLITTAITLQFLPDIVPVHYNFAGEIDRWGSKYEYFIFSAIILAFALFWQLIIQGNEKEAAKAIRQKDKVQAQSTLKVLRITGLVMIISFAIIQAVILYSCSVEAATNATTAHIEVGKIACLISGVVFIALGNFMPKARNNSLAGVRTTWSRYNDVTWLKSNRFGAFAMVGAGLATIVTAVVAPSTYAIILMLVYVTLALIITVVYSYVIYKKESTQQ